MLKNNILNTIKYFAIFKYPLTAWECFHWLYGEPDKAKYQDLLKQLDLMVDEGILEMSDGFYFLPGQHRHAVIRQRRYLIAQLKYNIALRAVKIIRALPFIKYVAVCNSLAYNNASEGSDIDLFIIAEKGKLWRARFVAATLMQLLHWRPTEQTAKDKICLSFLVGEDGLNIKSVAIEDDIYLKYWLIHLVPLYDPNNLHKKLMQANNGWLRPNLPNYLVYKTNDMRKVKNNYIIKLVKYILEFILSPKVFERLLRRLQFAILSNDLKTIANKDTRVVMTDQILKFHLLDRREEYRDKFKKNIADVKA